MARRPLTFKQRDVERAVKAAQNAGLPVGGFEIAKDGSIRVISATDTPGNDEKELAEFRRQHGYA